MNNFIDRMDEVKLENLIQQFEKMSEAITKIIEASGEHEDNTGVLKFNGNINDFSKLTDIYKGLKNNENVVLTYVDDNGNVQKVLLSAGDDDTLAQLDKWRKGIVGSWDTEKWSGFGFGNDSLNKLDSSKQKDVVNAYDILVDRLETQGIDRLTVSDKLYETLKEKGVTFETEDAEKKKATILLDAIADSQGVEDFLKMLEEIIEEAMKISIDSNGFNLEEYLWAVHAITGAGADAYRIPSTVTSRANANDIDRGARENSAHMDTGGYTGHWQFADTGMYTGEWPDGSTRRNGRLAWLHQKELVLNAHDTENFLDAMEIVRQLDNLTNWMANGLGTLAPSVIETEGQDLNQNVTITAEFPNATDRNEIEAAFDNLVNLASQYANRK